MLDGRILSAAMDVVDVAMAIVGPDGRVAWCNAAYAEAMGRPVDELLGADFFDEAPPCDGMNDFRPVSRDGVVTISGEGPAGFVDVAIRPVAAGSDHELVVVRRGLVRPLTPGRLPPEVVDELRAFVTELTGHVADLAQLTTPPLSILLLAIGDLDAVRSDYGDEAVEEVLRQVAQALVLQKRKADVIARYREGQFLVLAPDTPRYGASMLADRIRRSVAALDIRSNGEPLRVSLFVHAAEYRWPIDGSVSGVVEKASAALALQSLQVVS